MLSYIEIIDSDSDGKSRKKKKGEKKHEVQGQHAVKIMNSDQVEKLNLYTDKTVVERRPRPSHTISAVEVNLQTQGELNTLTDQSVMEVASGTQKWEVTLLGLIREPDIQKQDIQKDLLDFLKPTALV